MQCATWQILPLAARNAFRAAISREFVYFRRESCDKWLMLAAVAVISEQRYVLCPIKGIFHENLIYGWKSKINLKSFSLTVGSSFFISPLFYHVNNKYADITLWARNSRILNWKKNLSNKTSKWRRKCIYERLLFDIMSGINICMSWAFHISSGAGIACPDSKCICFHYCTTFRSILRENE